MNWESVKRYLVNPKSIYPRMVVKLATSKYMPDELALRMLYRVKVGKRLDLANPKGYNEKLQWLKLHDHNPEYNVIVDKYLVKDWVSNRIGNEFIIPTYGVWDNFDDIDFNTLPNSFVLKCTHDSGGLVICRSKTNFDVNSARTKINQSMKTNFFWHAREWPYKDVPPRIIAEEYIGANDSDARDDDSFGRVQAGPDDYKVMCFDGVPKLIELHRGRYTEWQTQDFYDTNWNLTDISNARVEKYKRSTAAVEAPENLGLMLELSAKLSEGFTHVRVDWYDVNGRLLFGEMTLYDGAGLVPFDNYEDDLLLGSWIQLPSE